MEFADVTASASRAPTSETARIAIGDQEPVRLGGEAPPSEPDCGVRARLQEPLQGAHDRVLEQPARAAPCSTPRNVRDASRRSPKRRNGGGGGRGVDARLDGSFAASLSVTLAGHQSRSCREEDGGARARRSAARARGMASAGVPGRQWPGLEPTASGSAPSFRSRRAPPPPARCSAARSPPPPRTPLCSTGRPMRWRRGEPVSPTARRRARRSRGWWGRA